MLLFECNRVFLNFNKKQNQLQSRNGVDERQIQMRDRLFCLTSMNLLKEIS